MPRWTASQIAQSCRLTRSQRSAASLGSNVGLAASSAAKSSEQVTVVRSTATGWRTNAATWSADAETIRLG